eukprot:1269748-Pyramimonas_sp.AAC.1
MPLFAYLTLHLWAKYPSWLQRSGIQASTSHYGILISEFGSGFEWRIALRLFDELEAAGIQVSSEPATVNFSVNDTPCPNFVHQHFMICYIYY